MSLPPLDLPSVIGFIGMACIIGAYAYLTLSAKPNPFVLHGTNLLGALFLTVSLIYHPNLPSLTLEAFWMAIAIWGLIKAIRQRRAKVVTADTDTGELP